MILCVLLILLTVDLLKAACIGCGAILSAFQIMKGIQNIQVKNPNTSHHNKMIHKHKITYDLVIVHLVIIY